MPDPKRKPLRWRDRKIKGRRFNAAKTRELTRAGKVYAIAQQNKYGTWFWYGQDRNTSDRPAALEEVQAEAYNVVKEHPNPRPFHNARDPTTWVEMRARMDEFMRRTENAREAVERWADRLILIVPPRPRTDDMRQMLDDMGVDYEPPGFWLGMDLGVEFRAVHWEGT